MNKTSFGTASGLYICMYTLSRSRSKRVYHDEDDDDAS